jgi:hypothetical protein
MMMIIIVLFFICMTFSNGTTTLIKNIGYALTVFLTIVVAL